MMKKIAGALMALGLLASTNVMAIDRAETVGVDMHYQDRENDKAVWSGSLSYARLVVKNLEVGVAYTFDGSDMSKNTLQGLQLVGRQWFGPYPKANNAIPFVEIAGGLEFSDGSYKNSGTVGAGIGLFVNDQSELRITLKQTWGGFQDVTAFNTGFYYHF